MGYHYINPSLKDFWKLSRAEVLQIENNLCCKTCYWYKVSNKCKIGEKIIDADLHYCKTWQWYKKVQVKNKY